MTEIKSAVEYIAKSLADQPEAVEVTESIEGPAVMIEMKVASQDIGRIIGRKGRTINAIRALARMLGAKADEKVSVELAD